MWYILRYILIRTGNRRPEALSEVAITRCVYVVLHGVSFFFFPLFSCQGDFRSFPWLTVERRGMSTEKKRSTTFRKNVPSLLFLPLLCRTNLYRTIRENRERNGGGRKRKKKEMTVSSAFLQFSIFFPSFLLPSFLSACSFFFLELLKEQF